MTVKGGLRFEIGNVRSEEYSTEHNDCVVRALKVAAGVPYADAHAFCARHGRRPRHGLKTSTILGFCDEPHVYGYKVARVEAILKGISLANAMAYLRKGRYLIVKCGHAIGCIDGVLYDNSPVGPNSRIRFVLKFTPTSELEAL